MSTLSLHPSIHPFIFLSVLSLGGILSNIFTNPQVLLLSHPHLLEEPALLRKRGICIFVSLLLPNIDLNKIQKKKNQKKKKKHKESKVLGLYLNSESTLISLKLWPQTALSRNPSSINERRFHLRCKFLPQIHQNFTSLKFHRIIFPSPSNSKI